MALDQNVDSAGVETLRDGEKHWVQNGHIEHSVLTLSGFATRAVRTHFILILSGFTAQAVRTHSVLTHSVLTLSGFQLRLLGLIPF